MAKIIDDETIENVCILAKLSLGEEAKEKAKQDMQKMLDYVEKLDELDTDGVEPLSHIFGDENVFRDDVVTNGDNKEAMLANAPKEKEGQYQVPKTIG
jgi:aspartyl-tRNA(Asn)/glutamyl-tRNA(Gln) amidotransferase subunit C